MISRRDLGNLIFRVTVTSFAFAAVLLLSHTMRSRKPCAGLRMA